METRPADPATATSAAGAAFAAAFGLAGALLPAVALLLDRASPPDVEWNERIEDLGGGRYTTYTLPLDPGRPAALALEWGGAAPARLRLHVRDDDGACRGERDAALAAQSPPHRGRLVIPLRAAAGGPHTLAWERLEGTPAELRMQVFERPPLSAVPLVTAAGVFALAGVAGLAGLASARGGRRTAARRAVSWGALLGIAAALGALGAVREQGALELRAQGVMEKT